MATDAGKEWLTGWKEIAGYLGVSVTTAFRWERDCQLPVIRNPAGKPMASKTDLHLWFRANQCKSN